MHNIGLFTGNVASHWVYLMGGIAGVFLAAVGEVKKQPWKNGFWIVAVACLIASTERAWQDEHRNTQTVIAEKSSIAAAFEECHTSAKVREAFTLGLETNALSARERIDSQEKMNETQANDIASCLVTMGKLNPMVKEHVETIAISIANGISPQNEKVEFAVIFFITNVQEQRFHGIVKCSFPFDIATFPTVQSESLGGLINDNPPTKVNDSEYEIRVIQHANEWNPTHPVFMMVRSPSGLGRCSFTSRN